VVVLVFEKRFLAVWSPLLEENEGIIEGTTNETVWRPFIYLTSGGGAGIERR